MDGSTGDVRDKRTLSNICDGAFAPAPDRVRVLLFAVDARDDEGMLKLDADFLTVEAVKNKTHAPI
jgi:hypothetical protein